MIAKKTFLLYVVFVNNEVLDFNSILEDSGADRLPSNLVIKNLAAFEKKYEEKELISIYNYLLMNVQDPEVIIQLIKLSDSHRSPSTLSVLMGILQLQEASDEEMLTNIRVISAKAIANYKDPSTVAIFLECLNNKNEHYRVRLACADALGRIGDKYAVKPLINVVEDEEEKSVYLKESATFALGLLGDTSAIDPLVAILESKHGLLDKFSFLKERIVEALGKLNINNKKVIIALKKTLMDSSAIVRINAIEAIMNSDDEDAINIIKPCLQDEDDEVKKNALIALYNLVGRDILDEVLNLPIYSDFLKLESKKLIDEYEDIDE